MLKKLLCGVLVLVSLAFLIAWFLWPDAPLIHAQSHADVARERILANESDEARFRAIAGHVQEAKREYRDVLSSLQPLTAELRRLDERIAATRQAGTGDDALLASLQRRLEELPEDPNAPVVIAEKEFRRAELEHDAEILLARAAARAKTIKETEILQERYRAVYAERLAWLRSQYEAITKLEEELQLAREEAKHRIALAAAGPFATTRGRDDLRQAAEELDRVRRAYRAAEDVAGEQTKLQKGQRTPAADALRTELEPKQAPVLDRIRERLKDSNAAKPSEPKGGETPNAKNE